MAMHLRIELRTDTTFSRGDGTAGLVDTEIAHDEFGCPLIPGRTIKGLLRDAWLQMADAFYGDDAAAQEVLGTEADLAPGGSGRLRIDTAEFAEDVRRWIRHAVTRDVNKVSPTDILEALTEIRRQTARDAETGGPRDNTLRSRRVILRDSTFLAPITVRDFEDKHWRVLARACLNVRDAGLGRNRGTGHVRLSLVDGSNDVTRAKAQL